MGESIWLQLLRQKETAPFLRYHAVRSQGKRQMRLKKRRGKPGTQTGAQLVW
jgi:hypothetical protein